MGVSYGLGKITQTTNKAENVFKSLMRFFHLLICTFCYFDFQTKEFQKFFYAAYTWIASVG